MAVELAGPLRVMVAPLPVEDTVPEMPQVDEDWVTEIVDPTPDAGIPVPPAFDYTRRSLDKSYLRTTSRVYNGKFLNR